MRTSIAWLVATLLLSTSASAAVFRSPNVNLLSTKTFKQTVQGSDKLTVAAFVAPWCGYCKKLAPDYDKVADSLKGLVNVVAVDCDVDQNKQLCGEMGIKGFPTLKIFPGGKSPAEEYMGAREARDIIRHATSRMPTFVKRAATSEDVEGLREKAKSKPVSLLFTSAAKVTPLYKALSTDFYRQIDFYAARDTKVGQDAMAAFGVDKVPALVVLESDDKVHKYEGPLKYDKIRAFLEPFATTKRSGGGRSKPVHDDL